MYDRHTVEGARKDLKYFMDFRDGWFKIMPDEKPDSFRSVFHLNHIYMQMMGYELLKRYDKRDAYIREMMVKDEDKDDLVSSARLAHEPVCEHCNKIGLRIISKDLMHRGNNRKWDAPEEVLFMLKCPSCEKNSAYWADGSMWEHRKTYCPKCKTVMDEKSLRRGKVLTTTHKCPACAHSYKTKLDFTEKEEDKLDPDFESDKYQYCFHDPKVLEEHRDAKRRYEGLLQMFKEHKEKEDNKHIYDAMANLTKLKIPELTPLLAPYLEKNNYTEFSLDKPEVGREVLIGFSCLDTKTDREDYDSRKMLKKLVDTALKDTNLRLMSDGIHYRLGYLTGRLRAYEQEEDIKQLVIKTKKLKPNL
jgi:hypothetical protein